MINFENNRIRYAIYRGKRISIEQANEMFEDSITRVNVLRCPCCKDSLFFVRSQNAKPYFQHSPYTYRDHKGCSLYEGYSGPWVRTQTKPVSNVVLGKISSQIDILNKDSETLINFEIKPYVFNNTIAFLFINLENGEKIYSCGKSILLDIEDELPIETSKYKIDKKGSIIAHNILVPKPLSKLDNLWLGIKTGSNICYKGIEAEVVSKEIKSSELYLNLGVLEKNANITIRVNDEKKTFDFVTAIEKGTLTIEKENEPKDKDRGNILERVCLAIDDLNDFDIDDIENSLLDSGIYDMYDLDKDCLKNTCVALYNKETLNRNDSAIFFTIIKKIDEAYGYINGKEARRLKPEYAPKALKYSLSS